MAIQAIHNYFYPRSPCGERPQTVTKWASSAKFLSTLSLRRATEPPRVVRKPTTDFYPRSPCGERHGSKRRTYQLNEFLSTLSLRRATQTSKLCNLLLTFLSTLSLRRATMQFFAYAHPGCISIHALLAESDFCFFVFDFLDLSFLSTLSLRRATRCSLVL